MKKLTQDEFIRRAKEVHGDKYDYSKVEYINCMTKVCIICPIHGETYETPSNHLRSCGCQMCYHEKHKKLVCGVGVNDLSYCPKHIYQKWISMLKRCYDKKFHTRYPSYINCTVCKEWLTLSNFMNWFNQNYIEGYELDKDILVKGNKVYSPQTCCFVPNEINVIFSNKTRQLDLPKGVTLNKHGKFVARTRINGVETRIGQYNNAIDAFNAYKREKEKWIKEVADKWKDQLEPRVYKALYNYKVEITD